MAVDKMFWQWLYLSTRRERYAFKISSVNHIPGRRFLNSAAVLRDLRVPIVAAGSSIRVSANAWQIVAIGSDAARRL